MTGLKKGGPLTLDELDRRDDLECDLANLGLLSDTLGDIEFWF